MGVRRGGRGPGTGCGGAWRGSFRRRLDPLLTGKAEGAWLSGQVAEAKDRQQGKQRKRGKRWAVSLLVLAAGLVWLDGPGVRWIGPLVARKFLEKAGITGELDVEGRISNGLRVERVDMRGGPLRWLRIKQVAPDYRLGELLRGRVRGVVVDGLEAGIDRAAMPAKDGSGAKEGAPDLTRLRRTMREVRARVIDMAVRADGVAVTLFDGDREVAKLQPSALRHEAGSGEVVLDLGQFHYGGDLGLPAQRVVLEWGDDRLGWRRFDVGMGVLVEDLRLEWDEHDLPKGGALVGIDDMRLRVSAADGGRRAEISSDGAPVRLAEVAARFGLKLPVTGVLESVRLSGLRPGEGWLDWDGQARLVVSGLSWDSWRAARLEASVRKQGPEADIGWQVEALGGDAKGRVAVEWPEPGDWSTLAASGDVRAGGLPAVVEELRRMEMLGRKGAGFPDSGLTSTWQAMLAKGKVESVDGTVNLSPAPGVGATPVSAQFKWQPLVSSLSAKLGVEGLAVEGGIDPETGDYAGSLAAEDLAGERLAPWLAAFGVDLPPGIAATFKAALAGNPREGKHRGSFEVGRVSWKREGLETVEGSAAGGFAWPGRVNLENLTVLQGKQRVVSRLQLADNTAELLDLAWFEGEQRLLQATAKVPVPPAGKWGDWRAWAEQETGMEVDVASGEIDFARVAAWLPPETKLPVSGHGEARLKVRGSPASPRVDGVFGLTGIRMPDHAGLPVTSAVVKFATGERGLVAEGEVRPAGYPAIRLDGVMAFRPRQWAEDPASLREEKIESRIVVPRIDLARLAALVPQARKLGGAARADLTIQGVVGKPEWEGSLLLDDVVFEMAGGRVPRVEKGRARISFGGHQARIEGITCESAGGSAEVTGTVDLTNPAQPVFALRMKGTGLPVVRDDTMIVRADADLRLEGGMDQARISGAVDVVDSLFHRDFELIPLNVPFTTPSRPRLPALEVEETAAGPAVAGPAGAWGLDVRVRTRDPILIRGNIARGDVTADLRVGGTVAAPRPAGRVIIGEARAGLPFSELVVRNGTLTFTPEGGLVPVLDVRGTSTVGIHDVSLFFYGPLTSPKTALTSDPPLPENEIMTLLATGSTSSGLEGGNLAMIKAAQLLVEEWRRGRLPFGRQIGRVADVAKTLDVRFGEDDPLSGRRVNSATLHVSDRWLLSGSVDQTGETRGVVAFVMRFR